MSPCLPLSSGSRERRQRNFLNVTSVFMTKSGKRNGDGKRPLRLISLLIFAAFAFSGCLYRGIPSTGSTDALRGEARGNAYYYYSVGVLENLAGNADEALGAFEKAFAIDPGSTYLAGELANLYLNKGDVSGAIEILEKSLLSGSENIDNRFLLAGLFVHGKELDRAVAEYERIIASDPGQDKAYEFLSLVYREKGEYDKAVMTLERLLEVKPGHVSAMQALARLYREMKREERAEAYYRKILDIDPLYEPALIELASLYEEQDRLDEAARIYENILEVNPGRDDIRFRLGRMLFEQDLYEQAIEAFEKVLKKNPENGQVRLALGIALFFEGKNYGAAETLFQELLEENGENETARYFLASTYERQGKPLKALESFSLVSPSSGLYGNSRVHMAILLKEDGRGDEAVSLLEKALATKPEPAIYVALATLHEERGKPEQAETTLLRGLTDNPENLEMRYRLGVLYEKSGRFEESILEMQRILDVEPDHAEALNFIGYGLADRGIRLDEAERLIRKALELKPENGYIIDSLGWVYFRKNRPDLAVSHLEKAHRILPEDPTIAEHLGDVYRALGKPREALRLYREALKGNPGSTALKEKIDRLLNDQKKGNPA